jgi:hypothetical protein
LRTVPADKHQGLNGSSLFIQLCRILPVTPI